MNWEKIEKEFEKAQKITIDGKEMDMFSLKERDKLLSFFRQKFEEEMVRVLPKEKKYPCCKNGCGCHICREIEGFNSCLAEIKQNIKGWIKTKQGKRV